MMVDGLCYVYVFETVLRGDDDDHPYFIKVGISASIHGRLEQINTASPRKHKVAWCFKFRDRKTAREVERLAHTFLAKDRHEGEWFDTSSLLALTAIFDAVMTLKINGATIDLSEAGFTASDLAYCLGREADLDRRWRFMP